MLYLCISGPNLVYYVHVYMAKRSKDNQLFYCSNHSLEVLTMKSDALCPALTIFADRAAVGTILLYLVIIKCGAEILTNPTYLPQQLVYVMLCFNLKHLILKIICSLGKRILGWGSEIFKCSFEITLLLSGTGLKIFSISWNISSSSLSFKVIINLMLDSYWFTDSYPLIQR